MRELRILKHSHMNAIRLIALGMPVQDAADLIGVSRSYMSTIYRSRQGQEFALALYAMANEYTARMLALGLTPRHIAAGASRVKPPKGTAKRPYPKDIHRNEWD